MSVSDWLIDELRVSGPAPSDELRDRVRTLATRTRPASNRRRRWIVVAAAALAASFGFATLQVLRATEPERAVVHGQVRGMEPSWTTAEVAPESLERGGSAQSDAVASSGTATPTYSAGRAAVAPAASRAQRFRADIVVHVDDNAELAAATARAMQLTRNLGGYLVSASQGTSADGRGRSALVVRVPTARVQRAIVRFAQLGTLLSQDVQVQDLQTQLDDSFRQAQSLRTRIAKLEAQPQSAERDAKLRLLRLRLDDLTGRSAGVKRSASFARVALTLTTAETAAIAPKPDRPGRIERAWHRAVGVLAQEVVIGLYAIVVAGPFALLAALAWIAARGGRRRAQEALLDRS